jgi:hypothetical protein
MTKKTPTSQDFDSGARAIRASGLTDVPLGRGASPDFSLFRASTNLSDTALDVIRPIVLGEGAIIVTGYENLLSVLAMVTSIRPGISFADRGALKIILTEQSRPSGRVARPARMTADRLAAYFLRPTGVNISDPRDFSAIGAREALASGAILVRIVNPDRLKREGKHAPEGVQANMIVGEDFAALSTGGFSRRDLLDRAIVIDRVASDGAPFGARRDAADLFWAAGNPCNREVTRILDGMLKPASIQEAVSAAVRTTLGYGPFLGSEGRHPVQSDLVGQALARVYENGFAFVSVPAGAGQSEIQDEILRRLEGNASRMIGGGGQPEGSWGVHVETSTGGRWSSDRIEGILAQKAPLVLDGSVAQNPGENEAEAAYRRMKCRHIPRGEHVGQTGFDGFPEIGKERVEAPATKGQALAWSAAREEIDRAMEGALDKPSETELKRLVRLLEQSTEAAFFAWKQGGMAARVRTSVKGVGAAKDADQNILPIFMGTEVEDSEAPDVIGEALSNRAFRGVDKTRLKMAVEIAKRHGQALCIVEDGLARHSLARRAAEMGDAPVLGVVSEAVMRKDSIPGRDASYQRAESAEVAMSMLGNNESGPLMIFASVDQAADMTLPAATVAIVFSVPEDVDRVAAGLSAIDGIAKSSNNISCVVIDDGIERAEKGAGICTDPQDLVSDAASQMRSVVSEAHDGVSDIVGELKSRLEKEVDLPTRGMCHVAVVESSEVFSIFVVAGTSEEADQAAMPPRLIVICRDSSSGEEVIRRNQVGCAEFLANIEWPEPVKDPRVHPVLPEAQYLDVVGRHMSHLTHWDARPERLVIPLERLAEFVSRNTETGEDLFSDLCLVSLEIIGRKWSAHLTESRRLAGVSEIGFEAAYNALLERPVWEIDEIRDEMISLIDLRIVEDANRPKTLHERVVAVIHGTGEASLAP